MKKILATILALTMIVGMSIVPAFAEDFTKGEGNEALGLGLGAQDPIPVSATVEEIGGIDKDTKIYGVDVEWENLTFTYIPDSYKLLWNPADLQYNGDKVSLENGDWQGTPEATVTVKNKSNASITVTVELGNTVDFELDKTTDTLASAAEGVEDLDDQANVVEKAFKITPKADVPEKAMSTVVYLTIEG